MNIEIPSFPAFKEVNPPAMPNLSVAEMVSWSKMADVNIEKIKDLVTFIDHSSESKINYDPATHGACLTAIDNWTEPDAISVQFGAYFSGNPESLKFITRLRTFLDQSKPNIFNLLIEAPMLRTKCLSMIGSMLLNELDHRIHVSILVITPTQSFAKAFIQWRKREFRCNHLFLSNLGKIELSNAFWESFQLGDDLCVVTIEDIEGEEKAGQIFEKFYRPQSSVQLLRLGNIKNVPREFFHAGLILAGAFDTLWMGLQIKLDGENLYTSMRGKDRSEAIDDRIKALINAPDQYQSKHLKMLFIGTGNRASGKTSTIRSLCGKSFKPDLPPTQCAEVVAQVQAPTDQDIDEGRVEGWTVYSMKKAVLRGYDAVSLKRSGALFAIYDFATHSQLFKPVLNNSCIVMLCINLMDMKLDAATEVMKLVDTLEQITRDAPLAPVIIIGTHADEYPSPAALKDLDKKIFIKVRSVTNQQVQPNAAQKLIFFPIENSRGAINEEQLGPIRFAVGGLVRRAEEAVYQRNSSARELLVNARNRTGGMVDALVQINKRPEVQLQSMDAFGQAANVYFLNMINTSDLNTFPIGGLLILGEAVGLAVEEQARLLAYYKAIGLIIHITPSETDNSILHRLMVLKPNWLYQNFNKMIYDPIENTKVYDVPPDVFDAVEKYERTGQATKKVLEVLLDRMKDYEREYVIELAMHWNLMTQTADSPDGGAEYVVYGMIPPN